jgi:cytochrome P450
MAKPASRFPADAPQFSPDEYFQDPAALFALLRASQPVAPVALPGNGRSWVITRYEDARAMLADPRLAKDPRKVYPDFDSQAHGHPLDLHMLNLDPPDHTRLRRLVQKAFTPGRVAALRPRVGEVAAGLLDATQAVADRSPDGVVDLLDQFAFRLPITVICELLGVPATDQDEFRAWTEQLVSGVDPEAFQDAAVAMHGYLTALIEATRGAAGDDLLSALVLARDEGDSLTARELVSMMFLLIVAGFETTVNLIAGGALALLAFPAEMARLRADPSLTAAAVEELLRYVNPVTHATQRFTLEELPVGGVVIPAGERVTVATSSANLDPERFPAPDRLDLGRDASGHVAFGHGIHYCLGAPLARMEGEIAIGSLVARFPGLSLAVPAGQLRWRPSSLIHGLESLPVRLR